MNRYRIRQFSIKKKRKNIASKIPTEILGEIFLHTIDEPISNFQDNIFISNIQDNSFPWAINLVCKSWRSAFVNYPKLWTWITINLADSYSRRQDKSVNRGLSLCLERSRNNPLNISLHMPTEEYNKTRPSFALVWETFLSCSHRWRIVYLANVLERQFIALGSCTGATPILESLTIHSPKDFSEYIYCTGFEIAPHLTRFTVLHLAALCAIRKWSVPWMQLTNLTLRFGDIIGVDDLLWVLFNQLRDIEELRLILEEDESEFDPSALVYNLETPQCLQHLRVLQVCCVGTLGLITAPSLSELYLDGTEYFYPQTLDGDLNEVLANEILSSFIQRSSCKIHKLALSDFWGHPEFTPLALVQLFPDVVELCLAGARICLQHLLSPSQFPGLRVLDCTTRMFDVEYFMQTLLAILRLRNSSSATCPAVPLAKVIFRPVLEDGETSVLVTTTDWASFESYVQIESCCEFNLTRHLWLPEEAPRSPPPATNDSPNTSIAPSPSSPTETTFPWI